MVFISNEYSRQKDVWGTAFAIWLNILDESNMQKSTEVLFDTYKNSTTLKNGYVKHIPESENMKETAWEKVTSKYNTYQNGGYWATPTGWYANALSLVDNETALELLEQFIHHTVEFEKDGAPFEWRSANDKCYSGLFYGASAALPYVGLKRIIDHN